MTPARDTTRFDTEATTVASHGLLSGFLRQCETGPGNIALMIGEQSWTYEELAGTARRWAGGLIEATRGRPRRVGVFAYRSETSYAGVLASLMAGAAFVPLNRKFPVERTRAMLEQADVDALIVDNESLPQLREVLRGIARQPALLLPATGADALARSYPGTVLDRAAIAASGLLATPQAVAGTDLAYLLFTSGSTGVPNGVPIAHSNVRSFLDVNGSRYGLTPQDRLTQTFDLTFDLSVFDMFMAWDSGAAVCAMQPIELLAPFKFLERNRITTWFSVPSAAALLLKRGALKPGSMPGLRWSLFCGEGLPAATAEAWQRAAPNSVVENLYGPTELTIACSVYRWNQATSPAECVNDLVPIGETYAGLPSIIVDDKLAEVEPGEAGELCVGGAQTSPGYWNNAERTAARFFRHQSIDGSTQWFHRTGDLVARRSGQLVYLGRRDTQIKVGGHRIELGEIEGVLRRGGSVEAIALPWPCEKQPDHIVAVVSGAASLASLEASARAHLPNYMVPRAIHTIGEMPLNANAKIDRKALRGWLLARMAEVPSLMAG